MNLEANLTCPKCGAKQKVTMPTDACQHFYRCQKCGEMLKPNDGDCCVFCSYADTKCPPKQLETLKGENMDFDYTVTTKKTFSEAVKAVEEETQGAGFRVLYIHDVTVTLKEKGYEIKPFKIIEICNAKSAYTILQADIKIGLCLPCKINVYIKDGQTYISGMRPVVLSQFFPEVNLGNLPTEVDTIIRGIIDKSK